VAGKLKIYNEIPPALKNEKGIPEDDLFLIRLAVWKPSILITGDCRLKVKLDGANLTNKYNLNIKKPPEFSNQAKKA
jgi:hypothetical protein